MDCKRGGNAWTQHFALNKKKKKEENLTWNPLAVYRL
jgi:hypothetical protein